MSGFLHSNEFDYPSNPVDFHLGNAVCNTADQFRRNTTDTTVAYSILSGGTFSIRRSNPAQQFLRSSPEKNYPCPVSLILTVFESVASALYLLLILILGCFLAYVPLMLSHSAHSHSAHPLLKPAQPFSTIRVLFLDGSAQNIPWRSDETLGDFKARVSALKPTTNTTALFVGLQQLPDTRNHLLMALLEFGPDRTVIERGRQLPGGADGGADSDSDRDADAPSDAAAESADEDEWPDDEADGRKMLERLKVITCFVYVADCMYSIVYVLECMDCTSAAYCVSDFVARMCS